MKVILGVIVAFLLGYQLGRQAAGGEEGAGQTRRFVDGAARVGLGAVQKARSSIQGRLGADPSMN